MILCSQCLDESASKEDRPRAAEQWKKNNLGGEIYMKINNIIQTAIDKTWRQLYCAAAQSSFIRGFES
jgi:hypothetical protein